MWNGAYRPSLFTPDIFTAHTIYLIASSHAHGQSIRNSIVESQPRAGPNYALTHHLTRPASQTLPPPSHNIPPNPKTHPRIHAPFFPTKHPQTRLPAFAAVNFSRFLMFQSGGCVAIQEANCSRPRGCSVVFPRFGTRGWTRTTPQSRVDSRGRDCEVRGDGEDKGWETWCLGWAAMQCCER